jgi:transcriptional regulator with XRE-family HTH domain
MESMGDRIRYFRIAKKMSLEQLGELCGVGRAAVYKWETGDTENIRLDAFLLLCTALGVDGQFLRWGPDRRPEGSPPSGDDTSATGRFRRPGGGG